MHEKLCNFAKYTLSGTKMFISKIYHVLNRLKHSIQTNVHCTM